MRSKGPRRRRRRSSRRRRSRNARAYGVWANVPGPATWVVRSERRRRTSRASVFANPHASALGGGEARPDNGGRPVQRQRCSKLLGPNAFATSSALALRSKPGRSVVAIPSAAGPYGFQALSAEAGRLAGASSALARANVACDSHAHAPARAPATSNAVEPRSKGSPSLVGPPVGPLGASVAQ